MNQYLDLLKKVRQEGKAKGDRTGTGTISVFGYQMRYDLSQNFPLLTTKKVHFKSMSYELLWFLKGDTNIQYLQENKVNIWNEWADKIGVKIINIKNDKFDSFFNINTKTDLEEANKLLKEYKNDYL